MILNTKQERAVNLMEDFDGNTKKDFYFSGSAGTGKTSSLKKVRFRDKDLVIGVALSHNAKEILRNSIDCTCITTAAALGKKKVDSYVTGQTKFVSSKFIDRESYTFIIDEASMTSIKDKMEMHLKYPNSKFIWVYDKYQLPCIGGISITEDAIPDIELTQNMRSTDVLSDEYEIIKWCIDNNKQYEPNLSHKLLINADVVEFYKNFEDTKFLCYHKDKRNKINRDVRKLVYQYEEDIVIGDEMIFNDNYCTKEGYILYQNSAEFKVTSFEKTKLKLGKNQKLPMYLLSGGEFKDVKFLPESSRIIYDKTLETLRKKALKNRSLWRNFFLYKALVPTLDFSYARTAYKAQGSTYGNVIVHSKDIMSVQHYRDLNLALRSLYVGMSRTGNLINYIK